MSAVGFHNFLPFLVKKIQNKVSACFYEISGKSLTNCENLSSIPLQEACSGFPVAACDLKFFSKAACDPENCSESRT
jgi:hypothetical protein